MKAKRISWTFYAVAISLFCSIAAHAQTSTYACEVALCLANPNGATSVSQCVPPIEKLMRDLLRGGSFPTCDMGAGNSQVYQPVNSSNCPKQFLIPIIDPDAGIIGERCRYTHVVSTNFDGKPYMNVYMNGTSAVTLNVSDSVNGITKN